MKIPAIPDATPEINRRLRRSLTLCRMGARWTSEDGDWDVELIKLDRRWCFRVRYLGGLMGDCYSDAEIGRILARYGLTLADLVEDTGE